MNLKTRIERLEIVRFPARGVHIVGNDLLTRLGVSTSAQEARTKGFDCIAAELADKAGMTIQDLKDFLRRRGER